MPISQELEAVRGINDPDQVMEILYKRAANVYDVQIALQNIGVKNVQVLPGIINGHFKALSEEWKDDEECSIKCDVLTYSAPIESDPDHENVVTWVPVREVKELEGHTYRGVIFGTLTIEGKSEHFNGPIELHGGVDCNILDYGGHRSPVIRRDQKN